MQHPRQTVDRTITVSRMELEVTCTLSQNLNFILLLLSIILHHLSPASIILISLLQPPEFMQQRGSDQRKPSPPSLLTINHHQLALSLSFIWVIAPRLMGNALCMFLYSSRGTRNFQLKATQIHYLCTGCPEVPRFELH